MNSDTYDGKHFFKIDVLKEYNYIQDDLLVILYLCLMLYSKRPFISNRKINLDRISGPIR